MHMGRHIDVDEIPHDSGERCPFLLYYFYNEVFSRPKLLFSAHESILCSQMQGNQCLQGILSLDHNCLIVLQILCHVSRPGGDDSDDLSSTMGITQAIISVFLDDDDKIRCINSGNTRINFLLRPPLYYVCVSSWGEPESVVSKPNFWLFIADVREERQDHILNTYICKF